ncbi:kinesin-related protein 4 isoform X1 [Cucumis melo var. makuwa]|uniref:Kinesin-related protein 4 isoform X1 n=2 Tax=Cucumis melo TaxID=3656 RepID=A0A5A7U7S2_CUCMM|nr:kinesin-related protein 4 isoform X1 [Cucumis melo var. makuwa]
MKAKENVTVTVRFRPLSVRELNKGDEIAWYADGEYTVRNEFNSSIAYGFDIVFGPTTTTRHVYDVAAHQVVSSAMNGINGSTELTLKFSGSAAGLVGDSFLSLGGSVERGFRSRGITEYQCALRICASFGSTRLIGASFGSTRLICVSSGSTRLICASFGSTRLICASFGSTRLICASFGSTRLICASFGSTRLRCAFYGTTRLLCRVGAQRGADRREAGRMREGHMDASGFLIASAMKMPPRRGARRGGRGGRGRGAGRVQPEVQPVAQAPDPAAPVGAQRGADRREAGRMREGHMDASGFLIASAIFQGVDDNNRETLSLELSKSVGLGGG